VFSLRHPPRSLAELRSDLQRIGLGIAYSLRPVRIGAVPHVLLASLRAALRLDQPGSALDGDIAAALDRHGFVGPCGTMDPDELMRGFRLGCFPTGHIGRKKWWILPERMTLEPHLIKRDKDVRRMIRSGRFRVTFDQSFPAVMRACAEPRKGHVPLTWITEDIIEAYVRLQEAGHAHSFEAWDEEGNLVGGGFGIAVGPAFVIESQFSRQRNASKIAMVTLLRHLSAWGFARADGKAHTDYLESMGFQPTSHAAYMAVLGRGPHQVRPAGPWAVDPALDASGDWQPAGPDEVAVPLARAS
jgi:leucyl/phenylalanyl-tRNA--protein transferase